jgi:hypothetical protein
MQPEVFARFWQTDLTRDCFLAHAPRDDLQAMRLACKAFAHDIAPTLFRNVTVSFSTQSFSRRARMSALTRIGRHVRQLSFHMAHTGETFLPPLLVPGSLEEVNITYEPRINSSRPQSSSSSTSSSSSGSKYGSWELHDLLIHQYPQLFHAATDVDAFHRAISAMPYLRHLHVSCPGQQAGQRYRKDIVDYALISLRLAVESANPMQLESLTLASIHPGAILYLRPQMTFGSQPTSSRVWRRVKHLHIQMDGFDYGRHHSADHLKILHSYLQNFQSLETFSFEWLGKRGPFPLSLHTEPCISRPVSLDSYKACPASSIRSPCRPLKFRRLRSMHLLNAELGADQASTFIMTYRKVLHDFNFDRCHLRSGTWEEAFAPLTRIIGDDSWKDKIQPPKQEEVMDVPIMLSPAHEKAEIECVQEQLWDDVVRRSRGLLTLRKVSSKTKELLPEVRRLLRATRVAWH